MMDGYGAKFYRTLGGELRQTTGAALATFRKYQRRHSGAASAAFFTGWDGASEGREREELLSEAGAAGKDEVWLKTCAVGYLCAVTWRNQPHRSRQGNVKRG